MRDLNHLANDLTKIEGFPAMSRIRQRDLDEKRSDYERSLSDRSSPRVQQEKLL